MPINTARRIAHFVDDMHMSMNELADQLGCSVGEAEKACKVAKSVTRIADARKTVDELKRLAVMFNVSVYDLVAMFA